jgi:hypothetical protein
MSSAPRREASSRWPVWIPTIVAGMAGLVLGYDFGNRLGGMLIGAVLALNGALFCSILAASAAERLLGARRAAGRGAEGERGEKA